MRVGPLRLLFASLCWCLLATGQSIALDLTCPQSLSVTQTAANVPSGWEATSGSEPASLQRVAFYIGSPKDRGTIVPDKTDKQNNEERVTWNFVRGPGDEFWLGCSYTGTTVVLAQKLSAGVSQCVVHYDLLPSGSRLRVRAISFT